MATLTTIRAAVRMDLHDEDSSAYRWADDVLDRHIQRAVKELGQRLPRERRTTLTSTADSRDLSLTPLVDLIAIAAVEWPVGLWPACYVRYQVYEQTLTLQVEAAPTGAESVQVFWSSLHTVDVAGSSLPSFAEDLVATGAAGYAALEQLFFTSNRINVGGKQVTFDLRRLAEERISRFQAELKRVSAQNRVRPLFMYTPG